MFKRTYRPDHGENRMRHEGDVRRARHYLLHEAGPNLRLLIRRRYEWMNRFIGPEDVGLEVGCGTGISKQFIRAKEYYLSDVAEYDWLDYRNVDALATPFDDESFDFVVCSNMIHHVAKPLGFFREMNRLLRPGGRLIIQEINASMAMRGVLRLMRHEGYSYEPNVFDENEICNDAADPWSANCAIPNLLFDDPKRFEQHVPDFGIVHQGFSEFSCMLNSGGVIAKTFHVPLPTPLVNLLYGVDTVLVRLLPRVFALQRQIVLTKTSPSVLRFAPPPTPRRVRQHAQVA